MMQTGKKKEKTRQNKTNLSSEHRHGDVYITICVEVTAQIKPSECTDGKWQIKSRPGKLSRTVEHKKLVLYSNRVS